MASIDAHADFFVACSALMYDDGFHAELDREMRETEGFVKCKTDVEWWQVVVNWFGAVAAYAYHSTDGPRGRLHGQGGASQAA